MKRKQVRVGAMVRMRSGPDRRVAFIITTVGTGVMVQFPDGTRLIKQLSSLERVKEHAGGTEDRNPDGNPR